ncbi:uncharacterized conserved protein [Methylobacterium sp. 4-46]|uniref:hypothetical protein n=1 Tax=unclassified Methylobacterium TaxID=2615210 RepID=UPI000152E167|nr:MULTISPECIES: hypothetical protein [Methylobacterium]ACA14686.1 uncharacterized conserved protein [Methylobacterium sp. 4-46]WFT80439.1 hypothetical protein QA634_00510 [Methylobacterium nodulans]
MPDALAPDRPGAAGWFGPRPVEPLTACGETVAVVRKKALLRLLARREAARLGLRATPEQVRETESQFRLCFGLAAAEDLAGWLAESGLDPAGFAEAMRDFTLVRLLEESLAPEIDRLAAAQVAVGTARLRPGA